MMNRYHTGERVVVEATLGVNGEAIDVSSLAVTAILVHVGRGTSSSRADCTKPGGTGVVRAAWDGAETAGWAPGTYSVQFWTPDGPYCHPLPGIEIARGYAP